MFSRTNTCENLARYAIKCSWDVLSQAARSRIKMHLLDSLGCALGALQAAPVQAIRSEQARAQDNGRCFLIGGGGATPERAAFYNSALIRYLDFMDTFVTAGEACHPSDNVGGILVAASLANALGRDFLAALALAYEVQCRLTDSGVPVMKAGFDHTVTQAISLACGIARVLHLSPEQVTNAIAIATVGCAGLAASRTGAHLSQWKGFASAEMALHVMHSVLLGAQGITGPTHVFEGPLGWKQILGKQFPRTWNGAYEAILECSLKRFNAEFHAQPCIEGLLELRSAHRLSATFVRSVRIEIFKVAYEMIGGGKYLDPKSVTTKEDADHSLPYMAAVSLLDGQLEPDQYESSRIRSKDVQSLLKKVTVKPNRAFTRDYPRTMTCRISIKLQNGRVVQREKHDFQGFYRKPMSYEEVTAKFRRLGSRVATDAQLQRITDCVATLETRPIHDLVSALQFSGRGMDRRQPPESPPEH